ncbi:MAG: TIGR01458 family HAD-type hydrolase [Methanomicrobiales archaeon]|nr:TIGR01458 family HAD-type hydrolase [Methanomicrobiales archaeon]
MNAIHAVLFDIDGVLLTGGRAVPGAAETLGILDDRGIPYRCISNTTRKSRDSIAAMLHAAGLFVPANAIITPAVAAASLLAQRGLLRCYLLTTADLHSDFAGAGIVYAEASADAVVIGDAGDNFTYASLNLAFRAVLNGAPCIALEKDRYWMDADGMSLSAGPFVKAIEYATGREAELVGKPSAAFFARALADLGAAASETVMIGDDIRSDIGGARQSGMQAFLVQTGKYRSADVQQAAIQPDRIIPSVAGLSAYL